MAASLLTSAKGLASLGEAGLLRKIRRWCSDGRAASVPLGDDAYVANSTTTGRLVLTTDTLLEGTHFNLRWMARSGWRGGLGWNALGYKAAAINLSDLASMGKVRPRFALITLGLHGDISVDNVDNLYRGFRYWARRSGFSIVGGDIIRSDKSIISMTLVGELEGSYPLTRSGARPGDLIWTTGALGRSAAGLKILKKQGKNLRNWERRLVRSHLFPTPRIREGRSLTDKDILATSALDTSDDLRTSLEILGESSGVGLEVDLDRLPADPDLERCRAAYGWSPGELKLYGGEDYELLFTAPESRQAQVRKKVPAARAIGRVRPKRFGLRILSSGRPYLGRDRRFRHF